MTIFLWVLQILLALHTAMGALWKLSHSEQVIPSLSALPHEVWNALSIIEIFFALGLLAPLAKKSLSPLALLAMGGIAAEMLLYTGMHLASGNPESGQMIYWLVVATLCGGMIFGRLKTQVSKRKRR